ncbi:hypothetical protein TrST_g11791 [Triparma strigata]|uniref:Uncharacterized protein n=1 Tax=Triparma strigata TaxID=1606541 RepID=A0A9W7EJH2_9STRA|nr:hypothetical protein TrST_g11791 [Triparma strigata]
MVHKNVTSFLKRVEALTVSSSPDTISSIALYMSLKARHKDSIVQAWRDRIGGWNGTLTGASLIPDFRVIHSFFTQCEEYHSTDPTFRSQILDDICPLLITRIVNANNNGNTNTNNNDNNNDNDNDNKDKEELQRSVSGWESGWSTGDALRRCKNALNAQSTSTSTSTSTTITTNTTTTTTTSDLKESLPPPPAAAAATDDDDDKSVSSKSSVSSTDSAPPSPKVPSELPPPPSASTFPKALSKHLSAINANELTLSIYRDPMLRLSQILTSPSSSESSWLLSSLPSSTPLTPSSVPSFPHPPSNLYGLSSTLLDVDISKSIQELKDYERSVKATLSARKSIVSLLSSPPPSESVSFYKDVFSRLSKWSSNVDLVGSEIEGALELQGEEIPKDNVIRGKDEFEEVVKWNEVLGKRKRKEHENNKRAKK